MGEMPAFLGTIPGWITAISSSGVLGLAIFAVFRHLPEILRALTERRKQGFDESTVLRGEKRADLSECHKRVDELSAELGKVKEAFQQQVHDLELKLLGAITGYKILDLEVETHMPGSTALGQARAAMSAAFTMSPSTPPNGARPKAKKPH